MKPTIEQRAYLRIKADLATAAMTRAFEATDRVLPELGGVELQAFVANPEQLAPPNFVDMPAIAIGSVDREGRIQEVLALAMHLSRDGMAARIRERFRPLNLPEIDIKLPPRDPS